MSERISAVLFHALTWPVPPARLHKRCAKQLGADPPRSGLCKGHGPQRPLQRPLGREGSRLLEGHREQIPLLTRRLEMHQRGGPWGREREKERLRLPSFIGKRTSAACAAWVPLHPALVRTARPCKRFHALSLGAFPPSLLEQHSLGLAQLQLWGNHRSHVLCHFVVALRLLCERRKVDLALKA